MVAVMQQLTVGMSPARMAQVSRLSYASCCVSWIYVSSRAQPACRLLWRLAAA